MAPKRLSTDYLLRLQKEAKILAIEPPLPSPPSDAEPSTSRLQKEAVKDFKTYEEYAESIDLARSHAFIEAFYACRNLPGHISLQYDLSRICFSVIPPRHRYLPNRYVETAEEVLAEKLEDDAAAEAQAWADAVPVVPDLPGEEEEEDEREEALVDYDSSLSDEAEDDD